MVRVPRTYRAPFAIVDTPRVRSIAALCLFVIACGKSDGTKSGPPSGTGSGPPSGPPLLAAFGASIASPGPLFEGLALDGPEDTRAKELNEHWDKAGDSTRYNIHVDFNKKKIEQLHINTLDSNSVEACSKARAALERAWSKPTEVDNRLVWFANDRKHRATFTIDRDDWCTFEIERYVAAADLAPATLFALIGQPASALTAVTDKPVADGETWWSADGLGPAGHGLAVVRVTVDNDKITGLLVEGQTVVALVDELRTHLDTMFGASAPIAGISGRGFRWKTGLQLTDRDGAFILSIGGHPPPSKPGAWTHRDRMWIYRYADGDEINYDTDARCRLNRACTNAGSDCVAGIAMNFACPPMSPEVEPAH